MSIELRNPASLTFCSDNILGVTHLSEVVKGWRRRLATQRPWTLICPLIRPFLCFFSSGPIFSYFPQRRRYLQVYAKPRANVRGRHFWEECLAVLLQPLSNRDTRRSDAGIAQDVTVERCSFSPLYTHTMTNPHIKVAANMIYSYCVRSISWGIYFVCACPG